MNFVILSEFRYSILITCFLDHFKSTFEVTCLSQRHGMIWITDWINCWVFEVELSSTVWRHPWNYDPCSSAIDDSFAFVAKTHGRHSWEPICYIVSSENIGKKTYVKIPEPQTWNKLFRFPSWMFQRYTEQ